MRGSTFLGVHSLKKVHSLEAEERMYGVLLLTLLRKTILADVGLEYNHRVNAHSTYLEDELRGF